MHTDPRVGLLSHPFIIKLENGTAGPAGNVRSVSDCFPTQTRTDSAGVVMPFITELRGTGKARPITRELNGITAGGPHSGIVTSESWNSFIASYYGGSNVTSGINEVVNTQGTKERHTLITYQTPAIEDCYYRMLFPHEIQLAMAFESDYVVLGNGKDKVKQLGNAVTPPAMEWLVERCIESLK
jgi:DNA (cytosine-5)-methyltransferase 1